MPIIVSNWSKFVIQILLLYVLFTVVFYLISDWVMFPIPKASYQTLSNEIKFKSIDGKELVGIWIKNPNAKYTVLFSHGNAEDLGTLLPLLKAYSEHGFSIFAYDYHGYGQSEGSPSENKTYLDIKAAYQYLTETLQIPPEHIILHGRSLGTGPTVELGSKVPVAGLILESAMLTAFRVLTKIPLFPLDKYSNNKKIKEIEVPILFIHGKQDDVIPFWHGQKLYDVVRAPKTFWAIEDAGHNNILKVAGNDYWKHIIDFANVLSKKDHYKN